MIIHVAGTARDCAEGLSERLSRLEEVLESGLGLSVCWHFFENDSKDHTRLVLGAFCDNRPNAVLLVEEGLDARIQARESRLAFCRNALLDSVFSSEDLRADATVPSLYMPLDLDLRIDWLGIEDELRSAVALISEGACIGIFPSSSPKYYDIHALRAQGWNEEDAWLEVAKAKKRYPKMSRTELRRKYIHARQLEADALRARGRLIWVRSAFGGFGIYRLESVRERLYESRPTDTCEHVAFNLGLERLAILTTMRIRAPDEHLGTVAPRIGPSGWLVSAARSALARTRMLSQRARFELTRIRTGPRGK